MEPATGRPDADANEFHEFLERCHDALRQHTGGDPRPYLQLWSHADDVSLMGGVGGHQVGIDAELVERVKGIGGQPRTSQGTAVADLKAATAKPAIRAAMATKTYRPAGCACVE